MLEWFLLIISKEYTLLWPDLQTFLVETIPCHVFDEEEMSNTYYKSSFMIRSTEVVIRGYSSKQVFLKITQYSQENTSLFNKITDLQACTLIIK